MEELGKMESTLMSSKRYLIFWDFCKCHKIQAEKCAKFLESELAESLVSSRKSEEEQDTKGLQ